MTYDNVCTAHERRFGDILVEISVCSGDNTSNFDIVPPPICLDRKFNFLYGGDVGGSGDIFPID